MQTTTSILIAMAILGMTLVGCSRSNDQETAALRADLEAANKTISELRVEISRGKNSGNPNDPQKQLPKPKPRLRIVRGLAPNWEYPVFEGRNVIGRADQLAVDIDLQPQEPEDRIWSSRQHAVITSKSGAMVIEDLNSANGTYVNQKRVPPGEKRTLSKDDIIQIGAVQIKVLE